MNTVTRKVEFSSSSAGASRELLEREWVVANGLGGYASGTISGQVSRRYHGLLTAALPLPTGRLMMLNYLGEAIRFADGRSASIGGNKDAGRSEETSANHYLREFRLENGIPFWTYDIQGCVIEKSLLMVHGQNTVQVTYRLLQGERATLELRPAVHFRPHENEVGGPPPEGYSLFIHGRRYEIGSLDWPAALRLFVSDEAARFVHEGGQPTEIDYQMEADRGYRSRGVLWSPGRFSVELRPGQPATFVASAEEWSTLLALRPEDAVKADRFRRQRLLAAAHASAREGLGAELVIAADQFVITPSGRVEDAARAKAAGDEVRTIIAGYHWFTDWGRDTMISLEGLTLSTGRHQEASWILRTFDHYVKNGLIPNLFPEGSRQGLYHTADASLWYFHAIDRYVRVTGDRDTLRALLPNLRSIIEFHIRGTLFGIHVDPGDALLTQGAEGYQLTWMDAKVDDWVVTPRRGKAVEINALWYNALRLMENWVREEGDDVAAIQYSESARRAYASFNRRFWSAQRGYLLDVVDGEHGDDDALRPNQLLAISLCHPVLDEACWSSVLEKVRSHLLTPFGLRTLSPNHPDYKSRYFGDLRARDAAYHQGTVWAWLLGPYIDSLLKLRPADVAEARACLEKLLVDLGQACVGSISEIFDAEPPFTPRGCIAQAWSVAEALRCWVKTATPPA